MKLRTMIKFFGLLICSISMAHGTIITTGLSPKGGNTWQADYTVKNDSLAVDIDRFEIEFNYNNYANLSYVNAPSGWSSLIDHPYAITDYHGAFDLLATNVGIKPGDTLGGFSLTFDWLGMGMPGMQTFKASDSAFTTQDTGSTSVPEPMPILLLAFGFIGILAKKSQLKRAV